MEQDLAEFITAENEFYALLHVPTRDDGATIKPKTAAGEGEIFGPSHETLAIVDRMFKAYVTRMGVYEDYIEVGVTKGAGLEYRQAARMGKEPHRTFTLPIKNISEIFREKLEMSPGFTIKTVNGDDFLFGVATTSGGLLSSSNNYDTEILDRVVDHVRERAGVSNNKEQVKSSGIELVDELERLRTLNDNGAITDEEFQTAKDKLLK